MILESANVLEAANPKLYGKLFASIRMTASKFKKDVCDKCDNPLCREALKKLDEKMKADEVEKVV